MSQTRRTVSGVLLIACLLVIVSMSAAFMGFVAFSPGTDESNRLLALFILTPLLVAVFAFLVALYRAVFAKQISRRRWARAGRRLASSGFRDATASEVQDTLGLPVQLLAPPILALQRGGGIDHVMVGSVGDRQVRCFNVRIRGGGWMDVPAVALRLDASFASTLIRPQRVPIRPRPDMKRAWFEHERFNRSLAVFSVDPFFANALVDPRMMDWLRQTCTGPRSSSPADGCSPGTCRGAGFAAARSSSSTSCRGSRNASLVRSPRCFRDGPTR